MTTIRLTDDAIRAALSLGSEVRAPVDLGGAIRASIEGVPQRRPRFGALSSLAGRPVMRLAIAALLVAALVGSALLVGSLILKQRDVIPAAITYHGGPERTGIMPGPAPVSPAHRCWPDVALGGLVGPYMPVVARGLVIIGDASGLVTAVSETSGAIAWAVAPGGPIYAGPAIADELVLVGSDDGALRALRLTDGTVAWEVHTDARVRTSPAVVDGVAYFGSDDGSLYAVDAATGAARWQRPTPGPIGRPSAVSNGLIFAGSDHAIAATMGAYDTADGAQRWMSPAGAGNVGSSIAGRELVYVVTGLDTGVEHALLALETATGHERWRFSVPSNEAEFAGALAEGIVFVVSLDGSVYALDAETGAPRWAAPFATGAGTGAVASWVDGTLFVASGDRTVYALDAAAGAERWREPVTGVPSAPAVVDGRLFVATSLGKLVCIGG